MKACWCRFMKKAAWNGPAESARPLDFGSFCPSLGLRKPGALLLAVTQNFRHNASEYPAFFRRIFVDARGVLDALDHQPILLEITFLRQNQVLAAIDLGKVDLPGVPPNFWLHHSRYDFAILVDGVLLVLSRLPGRG